MSFLLGGRLSPDGKMIAYAVSNKMQEAVGGVRLGEATYEFPKEMRAYTKPVPHYVYHVFRQDWELALEYVRTVT